MRYRVVTRFSTVSFDERDKEKAFKLYDEEGIQLFQCKDLGDDGILISGIEGNFKWLPA